MFPVLSLRTGGHGGGLVQDLGTDAVDSANESVVAQGFLDCGCAFLPLLREVLDVRRGSAGRRAVPLPGPLVVMLRKHKEVQTRERKTAGNLWTESDYVFTKPLGRPSARNTDYHDWKKLLEDAEARDARLRDARHTAATVLMLLGIPDRVIDQIMGWEAGASSRMRARFLHVPDAMLKEVAQKLADAIWGPAPNALVDKDQNNEG